MVRLAGQHIHMDAHTASRRHKQQHAHISGRVSRPVVYATAVAAELFIGSGPAVRGEIV